MQDVFGHSCHAGFGQHHDFSVLVWHALGQGWNHFGCRSAQRQPEHATSVLAGDDELRKAGFIKRIQTHSAATGRKFWHYAAHGSLRSFKCVQVRGQPLAVASGNPDAAIRIGTRRQRQVQPGRVVKQAVFQQAVQNWPEAGRAWADTFG